MNNPVPSRISTPQAPPPYPRDCSSSSILFALGVVLMCFGQAITGRHEVTMIGLGLIVFTSMCEF